MSTPHDITQHRIAQLERKQDAAQTFIRAIDHHQANLQHQITELALEIATRTPTKENAMSGSSEHASLERRVATLADNITAAQSLIGNLQQRIHAIEEALRLRDEADRAQTELFGQPKKTAKRGN